MNNGRLTCVLVVEADLRLREGIAQSLRQEGFEVVPCVDPAEAAQHLRRRSADAVCVGMHQLNSSAELELIRLVRASLPDAVILAHGAQPLVDVVIECFKNGVQDFLTRPDRLDDFVFKLKRLLLHRALTREDRDLTLSAARQETDSGHDESHERADGVHDASETNLRAATRSFEREHVLRVLDRCRFDKHTAADALGIGLSSLYRKMDELSIPLRNLNNGNTDTVHAGSSQAAYGNA